MANSVENVGGGRGRGEELGEQVVATSFEDDLVIDVGYVHHLHKI